MYSRRFEEAPSIPQNYAGVALDAEREGKEENALRMPPCPAPSPPEEIPCRTPCASGTRGWPNEDLLLLLLAFMLMGNPEAEELPTLLLLLLVFQG